MHKAIAAILLCSACATIDEGAVDDDAMDDDVSVEEVSQAGISFNGISFNGISFNGISFNGTSLAGASLSSVSVAGKSSTGASITASSTSGPPLSGAALVGSTWNATATNGALVKLRIDGVAQGTAPNADLWFYKISYQTSSSWSPLCGLDASSQAIQAVAIAGVWKAVTGDTASYGASATQFTLACRNNTVAKCVELGYKTYKGYSNQMASCVRLLRGDFCGTGAAYTVNGATVNLYDNVGVQADTQAWKPEAEWTPTGARCVNHNNLARYNIALSKDPRCVKPLKTSTCGTTFASGAVLINEFGSQ
jgi:ADYC domain